jgi:hypothetical protein
MDILGLSVSGIETTTFSLTGIIEVFSWPKNWTIENVSTQFAFSLYALIAPIFRAKQFT